MNQGWLLAGLLLTASLVGGCRKPRVAEAVNALPVREDGGLELVAATFNIRYENTGDQDSRAWSSRLESAVPLIRRMNPDLIGMQELLHGQAVDLWASLPDYGFFGHGRDDGHRTGEYAGIFYRGGRFSRDPSDGGTFWLSATPGQAGSATWGNTLPRIVTWTRLLDRSSGRGFYLFNAHLDHRHQGSREQAARLIASRIDARKHPDEPVILLGDFNAIETNPAVAYLAGNIATLSGEKLRWPNGLTDTFQHLHASVKSRRTLHLWSGSRDGNLKVDHIFVSKDARIVDAAIVAETSPFSSDHFPVTVRVIFPAK